MPRRARMLFLFLALGARPAGAADEGLTFFESKIRPLLVDRCYKCHSDGQKIKGDLRLDTRELALKGGKTRPAIIPGHPEKSLLIEAVQYNNPDLQMPPKEKLSDRQIADLTTWIKLGAPDPRTGTAAVATATQPAV